MRKTIILFFIFCALSTSLFSQSNYSWIFNSGGNGDDQALAVTTDGSGNVYVAGYFTGTVSFGTTSLTSAGDKDMFLVKLNTSGTIQWAKKGGGTAADQAIDIKCDASNNIYTLGSHEGSATFGTTTIDNADGAKSFITKWDNSGNVLSVVNLGGYGKSFTLDASGNIYLASVYSGTIKVITSSHTSHGLDDAYVAKITAAGSESWVKTMWSTDGNETPIAITLTPGDSILVTGRFGATLNFDGSTSVTANNGGASNEDLLLVKYANDGSFAWYKQFDGSMANFSAPKSLITDADGNIYIAGSYLTSINFFSNYFTTAGGSDLFIAKLASNGASAVWAKKVGGTGADAALTLGLDASNNVYFTGYYTGILAFETSTLPNSGNSNIFLAKYNTAGTFQWAKFAGGVGEDGGLGVSVLTDGSAIICGKFSNSALFHGTTITSNGSLDMFVAKSASTFTPRLTAAYTANPTTGMEGVQITFTDQSTGTPNHWAWSFPGGTPDTSNIQNPTVTYSTQGTYAASLFTSNTYSETDQLTKASYITITPYVSTCNAVQFDGTDDHIDCGSRSSLRVNSNFTIEAWVKPAAETGFPFSYLTKTATAANGYGIGYVNGKLRFIIQPTNLLISAIDNMPGATVPLNEWSHIACSYDGKDAKIYVNGALVESQTLASSTTSLTWSTNPAAIYIGKCTNYDGSLFFQGGVDDVRIWKTTRTAAEINANKDMKLLGTEANLAAYWKLDEGAGLTAGDATVNNYDGTLKNGTAWITTTHSCSGVGVDENINHQQILSIYPNPSSQTITLDYHSMKTTQATISDITGKLIATFELTSDQTTFDITTLNSGVYFIRIVNDNNVEVQRFIKR
jgi:PKD repeat protein